jgi:hypothetical protein
VGESQKSAPSPEDFWGENRKLTERRKNTNNKQQKFKLQEINHHCMLNIFEKSLKIF